MLKADKDAARALSASELEVLFALASACPYADEWRLAAARLA